MHIPDFPGMAVTWDLEKSAVMIYGKSKSTGQGWWRLVVFYEKTEGYCREEDHYPIFFISDIQYSTENPENVKISAFLYFIRSNILRYDI